LAGLFEVNLIYCFEKKGVLLNSYDEESVISSLNHQQFKEFQASGIISEGMIPKLENGFAAIHAGVKKVVITNTNGLKNDLHGTVLT
jgi:acetylglutamate kinase